MSEASMQCPKCASALDAESRYPAELPEAENPDTTYQGRHRRGIMQQIFADH
ncbi:hypothetical protein [Actinomadura nitritigenes]|uniref:hypothetical protein n=1 Tax=Actinomadura nitritigenes TaxID=134602 RepID=UPI003D8F08C4